MIPSPRTETATHDLFAAIETGALGEHGWCDQLPHTDELAVRREAKDQHVTDRRTSVG